MKKIFILLLVATTALSCLTGGTFSESYVADITFEFSDRAYTDSFKDSLFVMKEGEGDAFFYMQYPVFFSQKNMAGKFQGGFLMSYLKGEPDGLLNKPASENDLYRVHAATGALGSKTYSVFYENPVESMMPRHDIDFGSKEIGTFTPYGCYVNNTTYVARKIAEHFTDGDKLVLKATGVKKDGSTVNASIVLAEYTEVKDSVMYRWSEFDLNSLGSVECIDFSVESTNPEVPGYFCMDGLVARIDIDY